MAAPFRVAGWTPGRVILYGRARLELWDRGGFRALLRERDRSLPRESFGRDASKGSGLKSICGECDREKAGAYYAANRAARLWRAGAP